MPLDPRTQHLLEQYLAHVMEVWALLQGMYDDLVADGWSEERAWEAVRRTESRILGSLTDFAARGAMVEEEIRALIEERTERE